MRRLFVVVVTAAVVAPSTAYATHVFSDVEDGSVHAPGIEYVADKGITTGCTPTTYCPNNPVTRAQMATFLFRSSGNDPATPPSVNADKVDGMDAADLAGAPGPAGPAGPPGPAGASGVSGTTVVRTTVNVAAGTANGVNDGATCPAGTIVTGGGVSANNGGTAADHIVFSGPVDTSGSFAQTLTGDVPTRWAGRYFNGAAAAVDVYIWALCAA